MYLTRELADVSGYAHEEVLQELIYGLSTVAKDYLCYPLEVFTTRCPDAALLAPLVVMMSVSTAFQTRAMYMQGPSQCLTHGLSNELQCEVSGKLYLLLGPCLSVIDFAPTRS